MICNSLRSIWIRGNRVKQYVRFNHYFAKEDIDHARNWLYQLTGSSIPRSEFEVTFSRSSGPGGQKVNKTSSKATISLKPLVWHNAQWIPGPVLQQLKKIGFRYETQTGSIVIQSDTHRSREQNLDECFERLAGELKRAVHFPSEVSPEDLARWGRIREKTNKERIMEKKKIGKKKQTRSKVNYEY